MSSHSSRLKKNIWSIYYYIPKKSEYESEQSIIRMEEIVAAGSKYAHYKINSKSAYWYGYNNFEEYALSIPNNEMINQIKHYLTHLANLKNSYQRDFDNETRLIFVNMVNVLGLYPSLSENRKHLANLLEIKTLISFRPIIICEGPRSTGKLEYMSLINKYFGEYACSLPSSLLINKKTVTFSEENTVSFFEQNGKTVISEYEVDESELLTVMDQGKVSREVAITLLRKNYNVVDAILECLELETTIENNKYDNNLQDQLKHVGDIFKSILDMLDALSIMFSKNEELKLTRCFIYLFNSKFINLFKTTRDFMIKVYREYEPYYVIPLENQLLNNICNENIFDIVIVLLQDLIYKFNEVHLLILHQDLLQTSKNYTEMKKLQFEDAITMFKVCKSSIEIEKNKQKYEEEEQVYNNEDDELY
jgi:NACalpha-BTF3-like transcription factor